MPQTAAGYQQQHSVARMANDICINDAEGLLLWPRIHNGLCPDLAELRLSNPKVPVINGSFHVFCWQRRSPGVALSLAWQSSNLRPQPIRLVNMAISK